MIHTNCAVRLRHIALFIMVLLTYLSECSAALKEFYMADFCTSSVNIRVSDSVILHFTRQAELPPKRSGSNKLLKCQLTISTVIQTHRLLLHIIKLHIDLKFADRLQIYEVSDTKLQRLSPATGLYGKYGGEVQISSDGITDYKTLRNAFYLDYKGLPTQEYSGFTILFTEFHDVPSYVGTCLGSYFQCTEADICISPSLKCDSYRNCGEYDDSDEVSCSLGLPADSKDGSENNAMPIALSVGIVATLTFLLVSLAIFLVTRLRRRQNATSRRETGSLTGSISRGRDRGTPDRGFELATLYAPPSYEDVMSSNPSINQENPPPYDSLVSLHIEEISPPRRRAGARQIHETSLTSATSLSLVGPTVRSTTNSFILSTCDRDKDVATSLTDSSSSLPNGTEVSNDSENHES
ncbi:uncharacterized protein LOC135469698 [Liolophura sinensis]|uniref:uncharacterized protein LOC135469698 n=1 Tax=Liolophura sinensis TaxID=3198878 RepID=UPI0031582D06